MTPAAVGVGGLELWRGHPARRCPGLCMHRAAAAPSSECIFHRHYVCPSLPTQNGRDGLAGCGGAESTLSRLTVPIKDVSEWRTSLEIVYTAWRVRHLCGDVMCAIRYVGLTVITRNVRPLTIKPKLHLYNLLWICCKTSCGYVVDLLLFVCCTWPSFCTKWQAQTIWVTMLACSSVYVASASIGLVLGLVLGLNLGLGRLCRKVGSIAALYALLLCTQARSSR